MGDRKDEKSTISDQNISSDLAKTNTYAYICAIMPSMASILLGYDIGVMSGAAIFIKEEFKLSDGKLEVLVGILSLYSIIGAAAAGRTSDWIGRRYTMVLAGSFFFVGAILMGFATNYAFLMFGRFVTGIGVGFAALIASVYTAEVSPTSSRGRLTSFPEVFINFGILLGYLSNYLFSKLPTNLGWRFMLGIGIIPSIFLIIMVFVMPESPRWLVMQGQIGKAKKVLDKTSNSVEESRQRLADIKKVVGIPESSTNDDVVQIRKHDSNGNEALKDLFLHPTPAVRHILIAAVGLHFFQQASGIDSVVLYSPRIFEKAGIKSPDKILLATVAVGITKTVFILVATVLFDKIGRRPLILASVAGKILSLAVLGFALTVIENSPHVRITWAVELSVAMVLSDVAFFSIGMGPMASVYSSEIFPLKLRAQGVSVGIIVNRVTSGVIGMTFLSLIHAINIQGVFFLYAGIAVVSWVFFFVVFPETRCRNLEDVDGLFGNLLWKFSAKKDVVKDGEVQLATNGHV